MKTLNNPLFPVDFSECSQRAFPYTLELARKFGAWSHLLFVAQDLSYLSVDDTAPKLLIDMTNEIALSGEVQMENFCAKNLRNFFQYKANMVIGNPKEKNFVCKRCLHRYDYYGYSRTKRD